MLQVTVTETKPIIELSLEDRAEQDAKTLRQIKSRGFIGWSKERYDKYIETHVFFKDYDLSPELREQHDRELAEFRELRDRELRIRLHIELDHTLSDAEKWQELRDTYPLEPENKSAGFYNTGSVMHFGGRLEREV
jgi:hypothetical protein